MDNLTLLSKAITALLSSFIMLRLKGWFGLDDLGIAAQLQTVVSLVSDMVISGIVGYLTYLIPLGQKYVHERILGKTVIVKDTTTGLSSIGEVQKVLVP